MAIKFSQFVVQTDASTLSHIVGYDGADNIQITPTNFLNSLLTGTPGQVLYYDTTGVAGENAFFWDNTNKRLGIGTNTPSYKVHIKDNSVTTGSKTLLQLQSDPINNGGSLNLDFRVSSANVDDRYVARISGMREGNGALSQLQFWTESAGLNQRMTITSAGNVGIGTATPTSKLEVDGDMSVTPGGVILLPDSSFLRFGTGGDATIYHDAIDTYFKNFTGDLIIQNNKDDKDIIFQSDNGSGGLATYFYLDGGNVLNRFEKSALFANNVSANFGNSFDLQIYHDGSNSRIYNDTGDLYIRNQADDKDIYFQSDNGSGGVATYFFLDGSDLMTRVDKRLRMSDAVSFQLGSNGNFEMYHLNGNTTLDNFTGNLTIRNSANDKDISFACDDGTGGATEYFYLDGSAASGGYIYTVFPDKSAASFGDSFDLNIFHYTHSYISNDTGNLIIQNNANDGDIIFKSDDGSGGLATYFQLDGSVASGGSVFTRFPDNSNLGFGDSDDLRIYHDSGDSRIENYSGDLQIINFADDKDIKFWSDDGSGGVSVYFQLDGSIADGTNKFTRFPDNSRAVFGTASDLQLFHNGTASFINNNTGDLNIANYANDKDIRFFCDDGSGSVAEYFRLDGSNSFTNFQLKARWVDNAEAEFGNSGDLKIYHDGANSYIETSASSAGDLYVKANGTGHDLYLQAADDILIRPQGGEIGVKVTGNGGVELYHNNTKKFQTESTGVKITGVTEHADNTAALAAGLAAGDVYRTGDDLKIVH